MATPLFESQVINISGPDGNAFAIMGRLASIFRQCGGQVAAYGEEPKTWEQVKSEMMSSDYANLLAIAGKYVVIESGSSADEDWEDDED